jgi:hypothetical protein
LSDNKTAALVLVSFYQVRFEAEALNQFQRRGLLGDEGIRPAFKQKTIVLPSLNDSAKTRAGFKQGKINLLARPKIALRNSVSRRETRDTPTDDYDAFHLNIRVSLLAASLC